MIPGLTREMFNDVTDIVSGEMKSLYKNPKYPSKPDEVSLVQNFDAPQNIGDYYGQDSSSFSSSYVDHSMETPEQTCLPD